MSASIDRTAEIYVFRSGVTPQPLMGQDPWVDDAPELSTLLASLEDIAHRISVIVERNETIEGVDAELVALERSIHGSLRRLRRATRSAEKRSY